MKNITVEELKQRMDSGEKINLIDCREPHEYEEANLGGQISSSWKNTDHADRRPGRYERGRSDHSLQKRSA